MTQEISLQLLMVRHTPMMLMEILQAMEQKPLCIISENHLTQVKDLQGASIASYTYDHEGKRTSMTIPSGTTYFHYSGDKVSYETDSSNNLSRVYL